MLSRCIEQENVCVILTSVPFHWVFVTTLVYVTDMQVMCNLSVFVCFVFDDI